MTTTAQDPGFVGPDPTNNGAVDIVMSAPFIVEVTVVGTATLLFHAWNNEAVAEKAAAKKGSETKKIDNVESYVYRDADGNICLPGQYLVGSLTNPQNGAAKYRRDPRSPRKSALDLYKAGVVALTELAPIIPADSTEPTARWDFLDSRRVTVNRSGVTRTRPAFLAGWQATVQLCCLTPDMIPAQELLETLVQAGALVGVGDFRPTFGRFQVTRWEVGLEP